MKPPLRVQYAGSLFADQHVEAAYRMHVARCAAALWFDSDVDACSHDCEKVKGPYQSKRVQAVH